MKFSVLKANDILAWQMAYRAAGIVSSAEAI